MEYTHFGDTGLEVSRLCLGTGGLSHTNEWDWGVNDRERSLEILEAAIDAGITFIDTANLYSYGEAEELVGKAIEGRREDVVIASKVGSRMGDGPNEVGLSRKHIMREIEGSLNRLGTDYLDLYYIHQWDDDTPIEETLRTLDHLVEQGVVRYIGASNLASWQLMQALRVSDVEGLERFVAVQPEYSLTRRHEEESLLPVAADQGLGVASYSPLAAGFLSGAFDRDADPEELDRGEGNWRDLAEFANEATWSVLDTVREIAEREGATPVQVSVAWVLAQGAVDAPIIGPLSVEQLEEYLGALEVTITEKDRERLEAPIEPAWSREIA